MSAISRLAHDVKMAFQDTAKAACSLSRAVSVLLEALNSIADLETRVEALERGIGPHKDNQIMGMRNTSGSRAMMHAVTHSHVNTNTAAGLLGRTPQTLRKWACYENGPLRPARVNGRLAWSVVDICRLLSNDESS